MNTKQILSITAFLGLALVSLQAQQWEVSTAQAWYAKQPWLVGCNYIPHYAINQLEMFQPETFDPTVIDQELKLAERIGMNTLRVFLHDLLWKQDAEGFKNRIDQFLKICAKHKMRVIFVLFDSTWDPQPKLGRQHDPISGVHNSGWVQSPGAAVLNDTEQWLTLLRYVQDLVGSFAKDVRILAWDLVNEPDNGSMSYQSTEIPLERKEEMGIFLTKKTFDWVREINPSQPLTTGLWTGNWENPSKMNDFNKWLLDNSDVVTFHGYYRADEFSKKLRALKNLSRRPIICTEYLARGSGSTFETILPIGKENKIGMISWGLVAGKTNTIYPWSSWDKPFPNEPEIWHQDIFRADGTPYRKEEVEFIQKLVKEK